MSSAYQELITMVAKTLAESKPELFAADADLSELGTTAKAANHFMRNQWERTVENMVVLFKSEFLIFDQKGFEELCGYPV